jgi:hypothetical protein
MKPDDNCPLCVEVLNESCLQFNNQFCQLREQYLTDPNMGADDVLVKVMEIMTPEQKQKVVDALVTQKKVEKI